MQPIRVLLADPLPPFRKLVRLHLEQHPRFQVVAEADDAAGAVEHAKKFRPDLALVEWKYRGVDAHALVPGLRAASPHMKIVLYTETEPDIPGRVGDHVLAWVPKSVEPTQLADHLERLVESN